ncbi:MAG: DM13 domain-containing protein [Gammaproteobacteria bacterium]
MKWLLLLFTHGGALALGFALGIYALPILTAPQPPEAAAMEAAAAQARFKGEFRRDLAGSDVFHWGEGTVLVGPRFVSLDGAVAPGPDYKLYLSPVFVETEADFLREKARMVRVGDVKTFENFVVPVTGDVDPADYSSVIVWCETFSEFISAAKYR